MIFIFHNYQLKCITCCKPTFKSIVPCSTVDSTNNKVNIQPFKKRISNSNFKANIYTKSPNQTS